MTPAAQAIMDRACADMAAAGERYRAYRAENPPRRPYTIEEMAEIFRWRVIDRMPAGADPVAFMAGVARIGINTKSEGEEP